MVSSLVILILNHLIVQTMIIIKTRRKVIKIEASFIQPKILLWRNSMTWMNLEFSWREFIQCKTYSTSWEVVELSSVKKIMAKINLKQLDKLHKRMWLLMQKGDKRTGSKNHGSLSTWATVYLPPLTQLDCCCVRGGIGAQLLKYWLWSKTPQVWKGLRVPPLPHSLAYCLTVRPVVVANR